MDHYGEYRSKRCTAEQAVKLVKSGDWVDYGSNNSFPVALDRALAGRKEELRNVKIRGNLLCGPFAVVDCDPEMAHFVYHSWHCSAYERRLCDAGRAFFIPMIFRDSERYYQSLRVDVAMVCVGPMDRHGYFNLGGAMGALLPILERAEKVVLEVNEAVPRIQGGEGESIHISQVDAVVEIGSRPLWEMSAPPPTETDMAIARHIFPHIRDGATIQLGIGGMPNALGSLIAQSELKDLGMHTELCSDGYLAMFLAGKLTNRRKSLHRGKGVLGLAIGSRALYDWVDDNPGIIAYPLRYVNDPAVIALNDDMISINSAVSVDLYGQVNAESAGDRQISGTGGQLDFVSGAVKSRGGKSFLCMSSSYVDKAGKRRSRIQPRLLGDIVTTPRSQVHYLVTEYGAAELSGLSTWERADAIIGLAHPDDREELIAAAQAQRIWLPHNKR